MLSMDTKLSFTTKIVKELLSHNFSVLLHNKDNLSEQCRSALLQEYEKDSSCP